MLVVVINFITVLRFEVSLFLPRYVHRPFQNALLTSDSQNNRRILSSFSLSPHPLQFVGG